MLTIFLISKVFNQALQQRDFSCVTKARKQYIKSSSISFVSLLTDKGLSKKFEISLTSFVINSQNLNPRKSFIPAALTSLPNPVSSPFASAPGESILCLWLT